MNVGKNLELDPEVEEDLRLIISYQDTNDRKCLNTLLERWTNIALGTAMQIMSNQSDAEDVVQEAYIKIIKNLKVYRGGYGIRSWVMRIVYNTCVDKKREESKRKKREEKVSQRRRVVVSNHSGNDEQQNELFALIKEKWDGLPQHYRMPVWMRHYEKMEFKEIASVLSVSENTVRSQAKRGLNKLKELLSKSGVTITAVILANALTHFQAQASSNIIISNIPSIVEASSTLGRSRVAASFFTANKIILLMCFAIALSVLVYFYNSQVINYAKPLEATSIPDKFKGWTENFISENLPSTITLIEGKLTHKKTGGQDDSSCFQSSSGKTNFLIKLPSANYPLKFSYSFKPLPQKQIVGSMAFYQNFSWFCQIKNWGDVSPIEHNLKNLEWHKEEYFLLENGIILRSDKINSMLNIYNRTDGRKNFILILQGSLFLDDFKLEKINPSECVDISKELNYLNNIPQQKRKGNVLSVLSGFDKKKVIFSFSYMKDLKRIKDMPNEEN